MGVEHTYEMAVKCGARGVDLAAVARGYGATGVTVRTTADLAAARTAVSRGRRPRA